MPESLLLRLCTHRDLVRLNIVHEIDAKHVEKTKPQRLDGRPRIKHT